MVRFGCYSIVSTASDGSSAAEIKGARQAGDATLVLCGRPASCGCRGCRGGHCGMACRVKSRGSKGCVGWGRSNEMFPSSHSHLGAVLMMYHVLL
jgi:hypothetical protein